MNYSVNNSHWLEGEPAPLHTYKAAKNKKKFDAGYPDSIVIHYTSGNDAASSALYLARDEVQASAHLVIGRDGSLYQLLPFDTIGWHAGISSYAGRDSWNNYSIGIELDNAGNLTKTGHQYVAWFGGKYSGDDVMAAVHRNELTPRYWHVYTQIQIAMCEMICRTLIEKYAISQIVGHEEISPTRKIDPGPAFPLDKFREKLLFHNRKEAELHIPEKGVVSIQKLNIRSGAGINHPLVAQPLTAGQAVNITDFVNGWYKVQTQIEGWVHASYIQDKQV